MRRIFFFSKLFIYFSSMKRHEGFLLVIRWKELHFSRAPRSFHFPTKTPGCYMPWFRYRNRLSSAAFYLLSPLTILPLEYPYRYTSRSGPDSGHILPWSFCKVATSTSPINMNTWYLLLVRLCNVHGRSLYARLGWFLIDPLIHLIEMLVENCETKRCIVYHQLPWKYFWDSRNIRADIFIHFELSKQGVLGGYWWFSFAFLYQSTLDGFNHFWN